MKTRTPDYVEEGHKPVWPKGENPAMRKLYDDLLADQKRVSYPVEPRR